MKRSTKVLTACLIVFLMLFAVCFSFAFSHSNVTADAAWDGSVSISFASGSGTETSPYLIKTEGQLAYFLGKLEAGVTYNGLYIRLECDLDMTGNVWNYAHGYAFEGTFIGNGYTVTADCPLFDDIGVNGTLAGLNYTTSHVTLERALLCDVNMGTIESCVVRGVVGNTSEAGVICTTNSGTVSNCGAIGSASAAGGGDYDADAAMVPYNSGSVSYCFSALELSASAPGKYNTARKDVLALGTAAVNSYYNSDLCTVAKAGVAMSTTEMKSESFLAQLRTNSLDIIWTAGADGYPELTHCNVPSAYIQGYEGVESLVHSSSHKTFTLCATSSNVTLYYTTDGSDPRSSSARMSANPGKTVTVYGDGVLKAVCSSGGEYGSVCVLDITSLIGSGTEADPYKISTAKQLNAIHQYPDKYFVLTKDIILSDADFEAGGAIVGGWIPITEFSGTLNGAGYAISGLRGNQGGFAASNKGTITTLRFTEHRMFGTGTFGAIANYNYGTITRCYVKSAFTTSDLPASSGSSTEAGGIAGNSTSGTISYCRIEGVIVLKGAPRWSWYYAGGIVGQGDADNCVCEGEIVILGSEHADNGWIGGVCGYGYAYNCRSVVSIYNKGQTFDYNLYVAGVCAKGGAYYCVANAPVYTATATTYINQDPTIYTFGPGNTCYSLSSSQREDSYPELDFVDEWMMTANGPVPQGVMDKDGHCYAPNGVASSSCDENAVMHFVCLLCNQSAAQEAEPIGHSWSDWTEIVAHTCTRSGLERRTCATCSKQENRSVSASHSFGEWYVAKNATCKEAGRTERVCSVCSATETDAIASLPHLEEYHVALPPTCTEPGNDIYVTCSVCDYTTYVEIPALGHNLSEWNVTTPATCTEDGVETRACTAVNCTEAESRAIPALGHNLSEWNVTTPATCTEDGVETRACTAVNCTEAKSRAIPALGHAYSEWTMLVEPSSEDDGFKSKLCGGCGDEVIELVLFASGDADGDGMMTNTDITIALRAMSGWNDEHEVMRMDTNYDGVVTNRDIIGIIQKLSGWN